MTKIAVMTDVHANLPALQAALDEIHREQCEAIYHAGDAIAIGPHPAECLDLLLRTPGMHMVLGNHEMWFAYGLPDPRPPWMSEGEVEHQKWVHAQLDPSLLATITGWPYVIDRECEGVRITFLHHAPADSPSGFAPVVPYPSGRGLDVLFGKHDTDLVFSGHTHADWNVAGRARYANVGSLRCHKEPLARFALPECHQGDYRLEKRAVRYDDASLFEALERRGVPERGFICETFFGGRGL